MRFLKLTIYLSLLTFSLFYGGHVLAATVTWDGSDSTAWSLDTNWVGGTAPASGDDVVIDGSYTNAPTLDLSGGSVTVNSLSLGSSATSVLTISNGDMDTKKLIVTGTATIGGSGTLTHTANTTTQTHVINLEAANLTISTGGTIDVSSKGFQHSEGPGQGANTDGSGGGTAGGSYGGKGGAGGATVAGSIYGSLTQPADLGSGAGDDGGGSGGSGGGAVKLTVSGTTEINGSNAISANGGNNVGCWNPGGGSGGSVWLTSGTLAGSGGIATNGGNATCASIPTGGGGGGGRIAVYYTTDNSTITYQAYGGTTNATGRFGGAGTIYKKPSGQTYGNLTIDNNDQDSVDDRYAGKTPIIETLTFDTIDVSNYGYLDITISANITYTTLNWSNQGIIADNGGTFALVSSGGSPTVPATARLLGNTPRTFTGLTVSGTLSHSDNTKTTEQQYVLDYTINGDLTINSGGVINVNYKGFQNSEGPGQGDDTGGSGGGTAGGSYGGKGGTGGEGAARSIYGSLTEPVDLGSGGGTNGSGLGGRGGGAIKLTVSGTATINGSSAISASGGTPASCWNPGGGSGGSVWLTAGILAGDGGIAANGGNATCVGGTGGGGGGGRIAVYYTTDNSTITYQAYGGTSYTSNRFGGAGTIYKKPSGQTYGNLTIDNNDQDSADDRYVGKTSIEGVITFDTLTIQNYGYLDIVTSSDDFTYSSLDWSNQGIIADNGGNIALLGPGSSPTIPATSRLVGNTPRVFTGLIINGTLTHTNNTATQQYVIDYTINGDLTINSGGAIDVNSKGFQHSEGPGQGTDTGGSGGGGGSYGGVGGRGAAVSAGSTYGSATEPTDLGSGGGDNGSLGGPGGGAVKLTVSGTATISGNGTISANGGPNAGNCWSPGTGSGGSVWLTAGTLAGGGSLAASGGNATCSNSGAGGGGRIAVYYETKNANLAVAANGGTGYRYGQAGTIVYNGEYVSVIDPGNGSGTDYTSLNAWESANQADLTASTTKAFNHAGITGSVSNGATVTGDTSGHKAEVNHATASQILLSNIRKPLTGTLTFSNGSTAVTGASTTFTTQIAEGEFIWLDADNVWAEVLTITSDTALTLAANYSGTGGAGAGSVKKYSFTSGEQIYQTQNVNYVVASDSGFQPIAVAKLRTTNGTADTTAVTIDGWTTSPTNYIKIWTDPSENYRHEEGHWNDSKYRLEVAGASALVIQEEYVNVDGLQVKLTASSTDDTYGIEIRPGSATNVVSVSHTLFKGAISGTSTGNSGLAVTTTDSETHIYNNILTDFVNSTNAISAVKYAVAGSHYLYNNTVQNCYNGYVQTAGTVYAKNNIAQDCTDGFSGTFDNSSLSNITDVSPGDGDFGTDADQGTVSSVSAYKLINNERDFTDIKVGMIVYNSSDATWSYVTAIDSSIQLSLNDDIMGSNENYNILTNMYGTVNFIDAAGGDFRLLNSDVTAINKGTDLSGDSNLPFDEDIESQERTKTWDVGADEGDYPVRLKDGTRLKGGVRLR